MLINLPTSKADLTCITLFLTGLPLAISLDLRPLSLPASGPGGHGHGQEVRVLPSAPPRLQVAAPVPPDGVRSLCPTGALR